MESRGVRYFQACNFQMRLRRTRCPRCLLLTSCNIFFKHSGRALYREPITRGTMERASFARVDSILAALNCPLCFEVRNSDQFSRVKWLHSYNSTPPTCKQHIMLRGSLPATILCSSRYYSYDVIGAFVCFFADSGHHSGHIRFLIPGISLW